MSAKMIHIGFRNYLATDTIVAIAVPASAPIKLSIQGARDMGVIIDLTAGRRTKSVIFTTSKYVVLSALEPATISGRLADGM